MYYYIKNTLEKTKKLDFKGGSGQFVAVLTSAEWLENRDKFDMGIEMDIDLSAIHSTKAEVNYDSLTGTFSIPDRENISAPNTNFAFALDEKGIVFIDDSGFVDKTISNIISSKRWTMPSLERFIYDFLEQIVSRDQIILERVDKELDIKQNRIMALLTMITSIFMPLTLIAGWYGMNFKYMPELEYKWAYPAVIAFSVAIVIVSLIFFKKKKWL